MRSLAILAAAVLMTSAACEPLISNTVVATGYSGPVHIEADGDSILITERAGRIWRQPLDGSPRSLWLDISARVLPSTDGEQGLLSLALDPSSDDFAVLYVAPASAGAPGGNTRVSVFEDGIERVLLSVPQQMPHHKGGTVEYGPDGLLYAGLGDDGSGSNAQDPTSPKGKIHRFDIAAGTSEIWAMGLRNPYRFSFDALTGDMWLTDVGAAQREEINFISGGNLLPGRNFGWPRWEGLLCTGVPCDLPGLVRPIYDYTHAEGCSIIGGHVHRGSVAFLGGTYLFADLCAGRVWGLVNGERVDVSSMSGLDRLSQVVAIEPDGMGRPTFALLGGRIVRIE